MNTGTTKRPREMAFWAEPHFPFCNWGEVDERNDDGTFTVVGVNRRPFIVVSYKVGMEASGRIVQLMKQRQQTMSLLEDLFKTQVQAIIALPHLKKNGKTKQKS